MKNILIIFASLFFALILCEIFLRLFYPQSLISTFFFQNKDGLYLNKNYGSAKHKTISDNKIAYYHFAPPHLRVSKKDMNMKINDIENKILILGSSIHFGWFLSYDETFVGLINKHLKQKNKQTKLLNSSVAAWGNASKLSYLKNFAKEIKPKYVIVFIQPDEFGASYNNSLYYVNEGKLMKGNRPVNKIKIFVNKFRVYHFLMANSHLMNFVRIQILKLKSFNLRKFHIDKKLINTSNFKSDNFEKALYKGKKIYEEMINFAKKNDMEIIFVYDGFKRIEDFDDNFYVLFKENRKIEEENSYSEKNPTAYFIKEEALIFFRKHNARFINFNSHFWQKNNDDTLNTFCEVKITKCITESRKNIVRKYFFSDESHPNAKFNKIFADALKKELVSIF